MLRRHVAFFQRIFARYQTGLMRELALSSGHAYSFYGADRDPLGTGIEPAPEEERRTLPFTVCRTAHLGRHIAWQWKAVGAAMFGDDDVLILDGGAGILTNWPAMLIARRRRKRVLLYTHGWLQKETGMKKIVKNLFYGLADGLLLYGNRARQIALENGFPADSLYVVYNSLDDAAIRAHADAVTEEQCAAFRASVFGRDASDPIVVSVGRLTTVKRFPLLVDALGVLRRRGVRMNLLLVGDGPDRDAIREKARSMGVTLAMPGARYDEAYLSLCIRSAAMTVVPGSAGLTVIHSLSYGTPVVVHDNDALHGPEAEALQENVNGVRFREGDAVDLARAIERVLTTLPPGPVVGRCCRMIVDGAYSPQRMRRVFDAAVAGVPASMVG